MASHLDDDRLLLEALGAAVAPEELDQRTHEALIEAAFLRTAPATELCDDVSSAELVAAAALRDALETYDTEQAEVALLAALRTAYRPDQLPEEAAQAQLSAVLEAPIPQARVHRRWRPPLWFAGAGAAAAALALVIIGQEPRPATVRPRLTVPGPSLIVARTTTTMFTAPFETQNTTARIDRIVALRTRELRHNRYLEWRVE